MLAVSLAAPEASEIDLGTGFGVIEARPAPVIRRVCTAGPWPGAWCNSDAACDGYPCAASNIFNLTVAVRFHAEPGELQIVETSIQQASDWLFDATDGQMQIGQVTIWNNAYGLKGHVAIDKEGSCQTATGTWGNYTAANCRLGFQNIQGSASCVAHELAHLIFDVRDEYKTELPGCSGNNTNTRWCPVLMSGEEPCLMECCQGIGTEFCWGQGNEDDPTDISGGNHDPDRSTQQSICRKGRSCWDQIGWSWPNTFLVPAGAPDPAANNLTAAPVQFTHQTSVGRIVLVLDRSGSMGLDMPTRLDRLKTAALDVVEVAHEAAEVGIVSFHSTEKMEVPLAPFNPNIDPARLLHKNAINNLTPQLATNIGDALRLARDMILNTGGVTGETAILLMTDGLNNRPQPDPNGDLDNALTLLNQDSIPVFVTCTGDDPGLDSQCARIAGFTNGSYVNEFHPAKLGETLVEFHELAMGRIAAGSISGTIVPSDEPSLVTAASRWPRVDSCASPTRRPAAGRQPCSPWPSTERTSSRHGPTWAHRRSSPRWRCSSS
jgi:hypothetical protein